MLITKYIKYSPWLLIALLCIACWHYHRSAASWQDKFDDEHTRAETLQTANAGLADTITDLNNRNNTLVDSLNARTDELKQQTARADATKRAYSEVLAAHTDWGSVRVPDAIAAVLQSAAGVHSDTSCKSSDTK